MQNFPLHAFFVVDEIASRKFAWNFSHQINIKVKSKIEKVFFRFPRIEFSNKKICCCVLKKNRKFDSTVEIRIFNFVYIFSIGKRIVSDEIFHVCLLASFSLGKSLWDVKSSVNRACQFIRYFSSIFSSLDALMISSHISEDLFCLSSHLHDIKISFCHNECSFHILNSLWHTYARKLS